jgi:hypothetical protein
MVLRGLPEAQLTSLGREGRVAGADGKTAADRNH